VEIEGMAIYQCMIDLGEFGGNLFVQDLLPRFTKQCQEIQELHIPFLVGGLYKKINKEK
jgi:hypothetical protein